jgi:NTE family protein
MPKAMKIGLALSGGGALGGAHVGVLEELEGHGVGFDMICGTSAGAIVGLLYSCGGLDAIEGVVEDLERHRIVGARTKVPAKHPDRVFAEIDEALRRHVRADDFTDLPIPFSCVATDVVTGELLVIEEGDPVAAVMASAAYPGVFPVQRVGDRYLIDGAVTRTLPADVLRRKGADFIIGSSLYRLTPIQTGGRKLRLSRIATALRAYEIMQGEITNLQMKYCDFCFTPPIDAYRWYDFDRVREIRDAGRAYARGEIGSLLRLMGRTV